MIRPEEMNAVNDLLKMEPYQVQAWLKEVWSNQKHAPDDFNWLGLAEGAALKARTHKDIHTAAFNIDWGAVAISLYDWMGSKLHSK